MPDQPKGDLTVGDVAERSGIAVSTVHFYEKKELIRSWRTEGNQRRYHRGVLRRIAIIRIAQRAGIPLAEIRDALEKMPHDQIPASKDWQTFADTWKSMLEWRITALLQLRDQLSSCIGCGCLSLKECPLRNPDDVLGQEGPGPRRLISDDNASDVFPEN